MPLWLSRFSNRGTRSNRPSAPLNVSEWVFLILQERPVDRHMDTCEESGLDFSRPTFHVNSLRVHFFF